MTQSGERGAEKECLERCAGSGERVLRAKSGACRAEKESLERSAGKVRAEHAERRKRV